MQTLTRLLCLLIWFGRLDPVSAVQKAVRIEVSFDLSPALPGQETYLNSTQHGDGQPSYSINIGLGTPLQFINARLQLGSSVLLVIDATTLVCSDAQGADNCTGLAYNKTTSTSVIDLAKGGSGWFVGDAVSLAGVTLYDQSFELIGDDYGFSYSEFGLAPGWQYQTSSTEEIYPSILTSLVMQERINSRAFSLWLNRNTASTGLLVLGGVDTAAYNDPLITIPMISDGFSSDIFVSWTGLTVTAPNGTLLTGLVADNFSIATSIRNYNEKLALPYNLITSIAGALGIPPLGDSLQIPCTNSGSLNLQFAGSTGPQITIPFTDLLSDIYDENNNPKILNGVRICVLKFGPAVSNDYAIFGSVFLNSAYIVIDYDQKQVSLAQGNRDISGSNIVEIASGSRGLSGGASTVTGPLPSDFTLAAASISSSALPTYKINGVISRYPPTAILYKVVAIILVVAV